MSKTWYRWHCGPLAAAVACAGILGIATSATAPASSPGAPPVAINPPKGIAFEPNRGQSDDAVRFIARGGDYTVFLTSTEAVFAPRSRLGAGASSPAPLRMKLVGANPAPVATGTNELPGKVNYFAGEAKRERLVDIPIYGKVHYAAVYPGVDLVFYDNRGNLEYDFIVAPGADPNVIALDFGGARAIAIDDDDGTLVLHTSAGEMRHSAPVIYQEREGARERVAGQWVFTGSQEVSVRVSSYDRARPLVIDPLISYSSYLGGRGDDRGMDIALDAAGNTYVAGGTTSSNFPGAAPRGTTSDAGFVTKVNAAGQLVYSTYVLDTDDRGVTGVTVDAMGNAYATGGTSNWRATASNDVFVVKLDAFGRALRPSGWFVTFGGDRIDWGNRIAVDGAGNVFVAGVTQSSVFPTTPGAFRRVAAGGADAFVTKINATGTAFVYSTLLGGNGDDSANDLALDVLGNVFVTGSTQSGNFPVTAAAYQRTHRGCGTVSCAKTVFVTKLNPWGTALVYSTYLGGSGIDQESFAEGIAVDGAGNAYVAGSTTADNFPTTAGVMQPKAGYPLCYYEVCTDAFVTKLNATGSALVYSTYLSGETWDAANGIAVDSAGNAYVTGSTGSRYFPIVNAWQPRGGSFEDAFVVKLNANASRFLYSSYLGGAGTRDAFAGASAAHGIAVDATGKAHVTGVTYATDFPTSIGAPQRAAGGCNSYYGCGDAFVTRIAASGGGAVQATTVSMTSVRAVRGGYINATWSGLPAPSPRDTIAIYALGEADEPYEVWGGWYTNGAAAGTVQLWIPATLATGWYEMRLWSNSSFDGPKARSSPFQIVAF
jgi:hypothetical protein